MYSSAGYKGGASLKTNQHKSVGGRKNAWCEGRKLGVAWPGSACKGRDVVSPGPEWEQRQRECDDHTTTAEGLELH